MTTGHRRFMMFVALLLLSVLAGCSSSKPFLQSMPNRMDGLFLTIRAEKPNNSIAIYDIEQDGTLSFAGGVEARRGETEWSTELTEAQRQRVLDMVEDFGWLSNEPVSTNAPVGHVYEITIRRGGQREKYEVVGDTSQILEMLAFLDEICMQRFDEYMQRLPRAGEPPR